MRYQITALAPFRVRSFCFQWPADLLTSWGFEMEGLILGWYILVETGSVTLLTLFGSLQYWGTLVSPVLGMVGDRIGHRTLLCMMRAVYAVLATSIASLAFAGLITPVIVLVIAGLMGFVRPSDLVMRNALIGATIPPSHLMSATSVARTTMDSARIAGTLVGAGLFAALGMGAAYIVVTACYVTAFTLTLGVARSPVVPPPAAGEPPAPSPWRDLKDGLAYLWDLPQSLAAMWLAFLVNMTAFPLSNGLLPYVAREIYRIDQTGLGMLVASFASGSLVGSIALTFLGAVFRPGRMITIAIALWYVVLLSFSLAAGPGGGGAILFVAGFVQSLGMLAMSVILLRSAEARYRGRVMGVRMLAVYGLPLGLLAAGFLIDNFGFVAMSTLYCVAGLACTGVIALRWHAALWPPHAEANVR
jgi:MFS family permease